MGFSTLVRQQWKWFQISSSDLRWTGASAGRSATGTTSQGRCVLWYQKHLADLLTDPRLSSQDRRKRERASDRSDNGVATLGDSTGGEAVVGVELKKIPKGTG